ncbi:dehydrogenase/reductase SDR family protein 7-like isoform X3 [Plodia interpunctella]|uniref:dehydrogenase/reductase SDR family protein 7-like isoform X3 n=1 Tax=Plodia interpunctella TaxID=58824 RepID=UPI002368AEB6|nr:dehydrogenase/reductase SDR family protein 7-like isoform X3 [Plodia interpunctella]
MTSSLGVLLYSFLLILPIYVFYKNYKKSLTKKRKAELRNKVVVITGASSGIGEALAHEFYGHGCMVVLAARRIDELLRVKQQLMSKKRIESPEPVVLKLDLGNLDECQEFVKKVLEICGHVDILVNNGGQAHSGSNLKTKFEIHKQVIYVNYFGTVIVTNGLLQSMRERKSGQIVIMSSVLGRMAVPFRAPYCASKHALIAYGDSLRAEVHKFNIGVSVIIPGFVQTDISVKAINGVTGEQLGGKLEDGAADGYTVDYAAGKFLDMIVNREKEAYLCQPILSVGIIIRQALPSLYFYLMSKRTH